MLSQPRCFLFALAVLALTKQESSADSYYSSQTGSSFLAGQVWVTNATSDGFGALQPGQVRIHFDGGWATSGAQPEGLDAVAFNSDLPLTPGQIAVPKGWQLAPNAVVPGLGRFTWVARSTSPLFNDLFVNITISDLGQNALPSHFWLASAVAGITPSATPANFAFHDSVIDYSQGPNQPWLRVPQAPDASWLGINPGPPELVHVTSTPEPSTLGMGAIALVGLLGRRALWVRSVGRRA